VHFAVAQLLFLLATLFTSSANCKEGKEEEEEERGREEAAFPGPHAFKKRPYDRPVRRFNRASSSFARSDKESSVGTMSDVGDTSSAGWHGVQNARGAIFAVFALSFIPILMWFITATTDFALKKCSKVYRSPSLEECRIILDNYSKSGLYFEPDDIVVVIDDDTGIQRAIRSASMGESAFWDPNAGLWEGDDYGGADRYDDYSQYPGEGEAEEIEPSAETKWNESDDRSRRHRGRRKKSSRKGRDGMDDDYDDDDEGNGRHGAWNGDVAGGKTRRDKCMKVHGDYCYTRLEEEHKTRRYLRGNFILAVIATMKLCACSVIVVAVTYALDTDPTATVAFFGLVWGSMWFSGGLSDLFRNYLFYFVILFTDKFHPGNVLGLEGRMREFGCVVDIEPLCVVVLVRRISEGDRRYREDLLLLDVSPYDFFAYQTATVLMWREGVKRKTRQQKSKTTPIGATRLGGGGRGGPRTVPETTK
jgi:hypothetical protein